MQNTAGEASELWLELMPFDQGSDPAPLQTLAALGRHTPSLAKPPERLVLESPAQSGSSKVQECSPGMAGVQC